MNPPLCPICGKYMKVLIPPSRPDRGEYHCYEDRKSIPINDPNVIDYFSNNPVT